MGLSQTEILHLDIWIYQDVASCVRTTLAHRTGARADAVGIYGVSRDLCRTVFTASERGANRVVQKNVDQTAMKEKFPRCFPREKIHQWWRGGGQGRRDLFGAWCRTKFARPRLFCKESQTRSIKLFSDFIHVKIYLRWVYIFHDNRTHRMTSGGVKCTVMYRNSTFCWGCVWQTQNYRVLLFFRILGLQVVSQFNFCGWYSWFITRDLDLHVQQKLQTPGTHMC